MRIYRILFVANAVLWLQEEGGLPFSFSLLSPRAKGQTMDKLIPLIIQLIGGAAGGNIVGKLFKNLDLNAVIATITGILGGVGGTQLADLLGVLKPIIDGIGGSGGDVVANGGASAIGGALLTAIVGMIKKAMAAKA
jgi:hypothetical protein